MCLIDIGGGTTDVAVFCQGAIRHTAVVPIAGDRITRDIAVVLRTPTKDAEEIKIRYACAVPALVAGKEDIKVAGGGQSRRPGSVAANSGRSGASALRGDLSVRADKNFVAAALSRRWLRVSY